MTVFNYDVGTSGFEISTPERMYPRLLQWTPKVDGLSAEAWSIAPHLATTLFSIQLWNDPHWYPQQKKYTGENLAQTLAKAAAVRTVCSTDIQVFNDTTRVVSLPHLQPYSTWIQGNATSGDLVDVHLTGALWGNEARALATNKNPTTVFIPPVPGMSSVTTGLVLMGPGRSSGDRIGMVCSVDARWNKGVHSMEQSPYYGLGNQGSPMKAAISSRNSNRHIVDGVLPRNTTDWTPIEADTEWLEGALGYETVFSQYPNPVSVALGNTQN